MDTPLHALDTHLAQGAVVITVNRRLERALLRAMADRAFRAAPAITAMEGWVQQQWDELQDLGFPGADRLLLTPFQARKLWQEVIEADADALALLSPAQLAKQAADAARLVAEWQMDPADGAFDQRDEYSVFRRWLGHYRQLLDRRQLADTAYASQQIQAAFRQGALARTPLLLLYGFDDLPPELVALCESAADEVSHWQPSAAPGAPPVRTRAPDCEAEIRAAALWSREQLEIDPGQTIGIIVPHLHGRRAMVERIFTEVYETAAWLPSEKRFAPPFNFSAGVPLGATPLVADALLLLELNQHQCLPDDWRRLLVSPFWGDSEDRARKQLLLTLNESSKTRLTMAEIRRMAERAQGEDDWPLADALQGVADLARRQPKRQPYTAWAAFFERQLQLCRWPGSRPLDSPEYQQQQHFYQLLDQLAQCDASLSSPAALTDALTLLRELAEAAVFQVQTRQSPVQILGVLEGAGLFFDACWMTGLSDIDWPPAAKPNPLLPLNLQIDGGLPRSSAERELHYARALTRRYRECSKRLVLSWPASEGDVALQPSQLICDADLVPLDALVSDTTPLQDYTEQVANSGRFEEVDCSRAPAWHDFAAPLPGGTGALRLQALCPFNAYAVYRLGAFPQERPALGFTAAERGIILHNLLAGLWQTLKDQQTLASYDQDALDQLVRDKVDDCLQPWRFRRSDLLHPHYYRLEQTRLRNLALNWLQLDLERSPFEVVATEVDQRINLPIFEGTHQAQLKGRIDRVDRLPSGKEAIVDYKSGAGSLNAWQGERPSDLQLPLYALARQDAVAISFAEVNAKRVAYAGVGCLPPDDGMIPGIVAPDKVYQSELPGDWQETLSYWRERAEKLLEEFVSGGCSTLLHNPSQAQYYRHLEPLNRRPERDTFTDSEAH